MLGWSANVVNEALFKGVVLKPVEDEARKGMQRLWDRFPCVYLPIGFKMQCLREVRTGEASPA